MLRAGLATLVLLVACSAPSNPGLRPHGVSRPEVAADIDWAETTFEGTRGVALYAQRWRPKAGEPKAVVVIHHGLVDHSDRYAGFAATLARAGYAVWALDMRGHGRSAGRRVTLDRIDELVDDLATFLARVRAEEPGRAVFLYGHSLGGLVSSLYAIERQPELAGLVLAAPALAFDAPPIQAAVVRLLAPVGPNAPALDTPHGGFSRRREVVAELDADPLVFQPKGPVRTPRAILDGVARVWAAPQRLRVPLLALHGTQDRLTAPSGSRDLVARAGAADRTLRLYDGLVHDLLREPDGAGERVTSEIVAWLDARTGGPAHPLPSSVSGRLRGDRRGQALAVELDARGERAPGDELAATAGLRLRLGAGRAGALGLGYHGGVDLRAGYVDGGIYEADAHVLGVALRGRGGATVFVSGGVGVGGVRGASATRAPLEVGLELPLGPVRLLSRAGLGWTLGGDAYADDALGLADEASAFVGLRLGRDRRYWSEVTAGSGPFLGATYRNLGGAELVGVVVGLELWGGN